MPLWEVIVPISLALTIAPILNGIGRKVKAKVQMRQGPSILQTWYDLASLLSMEAILPTDRPSFRLAPYVALASAIAAATVLPYGGLSPLRFSGDFFVFLYVVAMVSIAYIVAGFSLPSTYTNAGANREMMMVLSIEPVLGIAIGILALNSHSLCLSYMPLHLHASPSIFLAIGLLAYAVYVEGGFVPFDAAEAETEILEGTLCEYSGRLLGIFKWAIMVKRFVLLWLLGSFIVLPLTGGFPGWTVFLLQLIVVLAIYFAAVTVETYNARLRIDQAIRMNTKVFLASLVILLIASLGW